MDDLQIVELYFARDEQAIQETDRKYGKLCFQRRTGDGSASSLPVSSAGQWIERGVSKWASRE